jgi:hypothetical protein
MDFCYSVHLFSDVCHPYFDRIEKRIAGMDSPTSASKLTLYDSNLGKLGHHVALHIVLQHLHDLSRCFLYVPSLCVQCYGSGFRITFFGSGAALSNHFVSGPDSDVKTMCVKKMYEFCFIKCTVPVPT